MSATPQQLPLLVLTWSPKPDVLTGCVLLDCGKTRIWELIRKKKIRAVKDGRNTKLDVQSLIDYRNNLPEKEFRK